MSGNIMKYQFKIYTLCIKYYYKIRVFLKWLEKIELDIKRASASMKVCCFPSCPNVTTLSTVSIAVRKKLLNDFQFYLPQRVKACAEHLDFNAWMDIDLIVLPLSSYEFNKKYIEDMIELLRKHPNTIEKVDEAKIELGSIK